MQWFKHSTGSHDDPDISDAMDEFGLSGYSTFFIILELYGQEFNHANRDGWVTFSKRFLERKLRASWLKKGKTLEKCWSERGVDRGKSRSYVGVCLEFYRSRGRIELQETPDMVSLKIPKFIEISSNWIKRKTPSPTEGLQSAYVAPTAKEVEVEVEQKKKRKTNPPLSPTGDFAKFYQEYPKKKAKGNAEKAWAKIAPDDVLANIICMAVKRARKSKDWLKEKGKYIPHPATWLNAKGWEDEIPDSEIIEESEQQLRASVSEGSQNIIDWAKRKMQEEDSE